MLSWASVVAEIIHLTANVNLVNLIGFYRFLSGLITTIILKRVAFYLIVDLLTQII